MEVDTTRADVTLPSVGGNGYLTGGTVYYRGQRRRIADADRVRHRRAVRSGERAVPGDRDDRLDARRRDGHRWAGSRTRRSRTRRARTRGPRAPTNPTSGRPGAPSPAADRRGQHRRRPLRRPSSATHRTDRRRAHRQRRRPRAPAARRATSAHARAGRSARTDYNADTGSGFATSVLTRAERDVERHDVRHVRHRHRSSTGTASADRDAGATCYRYTLTGTDNVGNQRDAHDDRAHLRGHRHRASR